MTDLRRKQRMGNIGSLIAAVLGLFGLRAGDPPPPEPDAPEMQPSGSEGTSVIAPIKRPSEHKTLEKSANGPLESLGDEFGHGTLRDPDDLPKPEEEREDLEPRITGGPDKPPKP